MSTFIEFVVNHWVLWSALVVVAGSLVWIEVSEKGGGRLSLTPQALIDRVNHTQAIVLDLRKTAAFEAGHIINAIHLPFDEIDKKIKKIQKYKTKHVIVYCDNGSTAAEAVVKLQNAGFARVLMLKGGINAWKQANLPLV